MQQQGNTPHLCHHYTVQNLEFGIWNLKSGIWNLEFGSVMYLQITTGSHTTRIIIIAVENFYWRVCIVPRRIKKQAAECPRKILWTGIVLAQLWHRAGMVWTVLAGAQASWQMKMEQLEFPGKIWWLRILKVLTMLPFSPKYLRYFTLCIEMLLVNGADRQNCLAVYGKQCTPGKFTLIVSDSMTQHL